MPKVRSAIIVAVVAGASLLAGTGYFSLNFAAPHDLTLTSVTATDTTDPRVRAQTGGGTKTERFTIVAFDTDTNLARVGHNALYIYLLMDTYLCEKGDVETAQISQGYSLVFDEHGEISVDRFHSGGSSSGLLPVQLSGRHRYHVYLKPREQGDAQFNHYDLETHPQDVCIVLKAWGEFSPSNRTNVLRVPAAAVTAAIARYRARHAPS